MKILLAIRGSIAAYRSPDLVKALVDAGHEVKCVLSQAAKEFVTETTLATFSGNPVLSNNAFAEDHLGTDHIAQARWADAVLIYGATADFLARYANGFADDFICLQLLATNVPVYVAPAMNPTMWENKAVQENVTKLKTRSVNFVGPIHGTVACMETGTGHIAEITDIVEAISPKEKKLTGKKILLSMGPMKTNVDTVRFIQNKSSGKMGAALAKALQSLGAEVHLLMGPVDSKIQSELTSFSKTNYETYEEYKSSLETLWPNYDVFFSLAAVQAKPLTEKIERAQLKEGTFILNIEPTEDLVAWAAANKKPHQKVVAFGLQSGSEDEILKAASEKLKKKNVDALIANPTWESTGPGSDENIFWIFTGNSKPTKMGPMRKDQLAQEALRAALLPALF